tara:strand:+ start:7336 stop:7494 length:159 start_codon:yes stop_codon:yes gene_type:complete
MDPKPNLKDEVRTALLKLHQKIDSLKEKVDKLCESTENCGGAPPGPSTKEKK